MAVTFYKALQIIRGLAQLLLYFKEANAFFKSDYVDIPVIGINENVLWFL
jgi:hypothetical protein